MARIQITDDHGTTTYITEGAAVIRHTDEGFSIETPVVSASYQPVRFDNEAFFASLPCEEHNDEFCTVYGHKH